MIIKCPKCGGSGKMFVQTHPESTVASHETTCDSCYGKGYVTDGVNQPTITVHVDLKEQHGD